MKNKMDSKLQKPSGLKRPMPVLKTILPMDRIKSSTNELTSFSSMSQTHIKPLGSNLGNIKEGVVSGNKRPGSPELLRRAGISMVSRAKLRRSRSACDLREINKPTKNNDLILNSLSNKSTRFGSNTAISNSLNANKPARSGLTSNSNSQAIIKKPTTITNNKLRNSATVTNTSITRKVSNTNVKQSTSTTTTSKTINKRIPPYDYKARFIDLQEKHKILKEKYETKCEQMNSLELVPEQLEDCQLQLCETKEQLKRVQSVSNSLETQVNTQEQKIKSLSTNLDSTKKELQQLQIIHEKMSKEYNLLSVEVVTLRENNEKYDKQVKELQEELNSCRDQLFDSNMERKELHNTVMDLRGNIRVFCRVRPPLDMENERILCNWNYLDEATVELQSNEINKNKLAAHTFSFDQVFHPCSTQEDIFEMVSPLIQSALDGYNICIFAYGQTGSGKTYTMDGTQTTPGVIPRTVDLLFTAIKNYKRLGWEYEIKATFLEIYNEVLYDLLSNEQKEMEIRMVKNSRSDIYVSNITEVVVETADELRELMDVAKMNRATASTVGNERSSRSHAVTRLELVGKHAQKQEISVGTINLVDLAGSESPKTSLRMQETKNINRSLSELTNVILALLQKQDHIPYRNSKLTHLLMPSLGGNSKTLMFINVSPFQDCFGESVKSLRFAASVNSCKMAKAKRNRYLNSGLNNSAAT